MAEVLSIQQPSRNDYSDWLPNIIRIIDVTRVTNARGLVENRAQVICGSFEASLTWTGQHADIRLKKGSLASIEWPEHLVSHREAMPIIRLVHLEEVEHGINLFETIPRSWVKDQSLIERATTLWQELPKSLQAFFNELFWDSGRFHRFLVVPGSLHGHHNEWHGNFVHALEVAEHAQRISIDMPGVSQPVLILAGLIHDAGKADEYRWNKGYWQRTEAGNLVGHKDLLKSWMGAVFDRQRGLLPEQWRHGLWHVLFSAKNAPAYLDIRESCMLEADILSMADRLSGSLDLHMRVGNPTGGFGSRHEHLRARPFRLPDHL